MGRDAAGGGGRGGVVGGQRMNPGTDTNAKGDTISTTRTFHSSAFVLGDMRVIGVLVLFS